MALQVGDVVAQDTKIATQLEVEAAHRAAIQKTLCDDMPGWAAWFVVQVRVGQEKFAKACFDSAGVDAWLPMVQVPKTGKRRGTGRKTTWRGRYDIALELAMPGFVLVRVIPSANAWYGLSDFEAVQNVMIRNCNDWNSMDSKRRFTSALRASEVKRLELLGKTIFAPWAVEPNMIAGDKVRLKDEPFERFQGFIMDRIAPEFFFWVEIDVMGRKTPILIHVDSLELLT